MSEPFLERLVPTPAGYDNDVKRAAARAERAWEVVTGTLTFAGAGGGAAVAAGALALPIAPFAAAIVAGSFYFKLRAKWAKEDPPRSDFHTATPFEPPRLELMAVLPSGSVPPGAAALPLLFSAAASVHATTVSLERALGAELAGASDPEAAAARSARLDEVQAHARRSAVLTASLHDATLDLREAFRPANYDDETRSPREAFAGVTGHLIAAGIDPAWLPEHMPRDVLPPSRAADGLFGFSEAAETAATFGAELSRWAGELRRD